MPPRRKQDPHIYVARFGFVASVDGQTYHVAQGERVRAGHPLLRAQFDSFEPVDTTVHYDVEQATAAPGELRDR